MVRVRQFEGFRFLVEKNLRPMELERNRIGTVGRRIGDDEIAPLEVVIVSSVVEFFTEAGGDFEPEIFVNRDVAAVEEPMDIGAQE